MTAELVTRVDCDMCEDVTSQPLYFGGKNFKEPHDVEVDDLPTGWSIIRVIKKTSAGPTSFNVFACPDCTPEEPKGVG